MLGFTLGQTLFFGGLGLLGLTIAVGIVFLIRKPVYRPGDMAPAEPGERGRTRPAASGHVTGPEASRQSTPHKGTEVLMTEIIQSPPPAGATELMEREGEGE